MHNKEFVSEIKRMQELAGINERLLTQVEVLQQKAETEDNPMLTSAEESESNEQKQEKLINQNPVERPEYLKQPETIIRSAEEISAHAENLYPGSKYHGMYTGEHMNEDVISNLEDDAEIILDL